MVGEIASKHRADLRDFARLRRAGRGARRATAASVGGIACAPPCAPRSSSSRVTSSTNSGTPPVRSLTPSIISSESACRLAISPTMRRTCARSSGASEIDAVVRAHGPGRSEFRPRRGDDEQRRLARRARRARAEDRARSDRPNADPRRREPLAESAPRPEPRPSSPPVADAATPRAAKFAARPGGSGMSTSGASRGAYSAASRPISRKVFSRSARRPSAVASAPKRSRPHSASGCSGVFCRSWDDAPFDPGVRRLGESARGTPRSGATCRAGLADDQDELAFAVAAAIPAARQQRPSSSSRPTKGVSARAPPLRPPPLARTTR